MNIRAHPPIPGPSYASAMPGAMRPAPTAEARRGGAVLLSLVLAGLHAAAWLAQGEQALPVSAFALVGLLAGLWLLRGEARAAWWPVAAPQLLAGALGLSLSAALSEGGLLWVLLGLQAALTVLAVIRLRAFADRRRPALPPLTPLPTEALPFMSLHLTLRDEPPRAVFETLNSLARLDYPCWEVLVLDASTVPGAWEPVAEQCARLGPRFRFFHLGGTLMEAQVLAFGLKASHPTSGMIGLLSAGLQADSQWLRRAASLFQRRDQGYVRFLTGAEPQEDASSAATVMDRGPAFVRTEALRLAGGWDASAPDPRYALSARLLRQGWHGAALLDERLSSPEAAPPPQDASRRAQAILHMAHQHADALLDSRHPGFLPAQRRRFLADLAGLGADALWLLSALLLSAHAALAAATSRPDLGTLLALLGLVGGAVGLRGLDAALRAAPGLKVLAVSRALAAMPFAGLAAWQHGLGRAGASVARPFRWAAALTLCCILATLAHAAAGSASALAWLSVISVLNLPWAAAWAGGKGFGQAGSAPSSPAGRLRAAWRTRPGA